MLKKSHTCLAILTATAIAASPVAAAPVAAGADVAPSTASEPAQTDEHGAQPVEFLLPAALAGGAVLAVAFWGFVAIGRRKPIERRASERERSAPVPGQSSASFAHDGAGYERDARRQSSAAA